MRGSFITSKLALPYLKKSSNPHIINLSPPINMQANWFENHTGYTMAKYGMSMCVLGMSAEFAQYGIGVNALWPVTAIATAAVEYELGGQAMIKKSRKVDIMADSAYEIMTADAKTCNGNFFTDEDVLRQVGVTDLTKYRVDPTVKDSELVPDLFLNFPDM